MYVCIFVFLLQASEQHGNFGDQTMGDTTGGNMDSIFHINSPNLCLNYSDRITEMHRQYLASIAPFNILFGNPAMASSSNNSPSQQMTDEFNSPNYASSSRTPSIPAAPSINGSSASYPDIESLDFSGDTLSNSSCSSDRMLTQSPSAFTPTGSSSKLVLKKEKCSTPDLVTTTSNKSPTAFSIENIIKKDWVSRNADGDKLASFAVFKLCDIKTIFSSIYIMLKSAQKGFVLF